MKKRNPRARTIGGSPASGAMVRQAEQCSVSYVTGGDCNRPSMEGAPLAICFKHAMDTYSFLAAHLAAIPDEVAESILGDVETRRLSTWNADLPAGEHVYYVEADGLVKIGYTANLSQRMRAYPPSSVLLAVEAGGRDLERRRHAQFARYLKVGREWHSRSEEILRHVNEINGEKVVGTPIQLGLFPKAA